MKMERSRMGAASNCSSWTEYKTANGEAAGCVWEGLKSLYNHPASNGLLLLAPESAENVHLFQHWSCLINIPFGVNGLCCVYKLCIKLTPDVCTRRRNLQKPSSKRGKADISAERKRKEIRKASARPSQGLKISSAKYYTQKLQLPKQVKGKWSEG